MKKIAVLIAALSCAASVFGFSKEGHQTIAAVAESLLTDKTRQALVAVLEDEAVLEASIWPDEIKPPFGRLAKTAEARAFNRDHKDNKSWHYVNFPVGSKRYTASSPFAYEVDIVHTINGCIDVLEGRQYKNLTQKEALRWLVHLVGDIHQPLHVIAGYYDLTEGVDAKLEKTVAEINRETTDLGGNRLDYGPGNMHSMWDKALVDDVYSTPDPKVLATEIMRGVNVSGYKLTGKYTAWAARFATDSMKQAAAAYEDIEFHGVTYDEHRELKAISVTLKPSTQEYRTKNKAVVKEQLRKAGIRLAQLLNAIEWDASL